MKRPSWFAPAVAIIAAVLAIVASMKGETWWPLFAATKPLATMALFAWAWDRVGDVPARRQRVLIGLALSLAGDVALLWPREGFLWGLAFFLLAHGAYIAAFAAGQRPFARMGPLLVYGGVAAVVLTYLWPHLSTGLRVPVVLYVVALIGMAAQAAIWWLDNRGGPMDPWARRAAFGGVLFVVSDASLAINKFAQPLPASGLIILSTYWLAQALFVSSLLPASRTGATRNSAKATSP